MSNIYFLRIELEGHLHGGPAPKPWVAKINGIDAKYGLARDFIKPMNDWRGAQAANSGNIYGVMANFALRDGNLYEVSRLRGRSSKRHLVREFLDLRDGKPVQIEPLEALSRAEGHADNVQVYEIPDADPVPRVSEVLGLGTPRPMGFIGDGAHRKYRLRLGCIYEVLTDDSRRFVASTDKGVEPISENAAMDLLRAIA